MESSDFLKAQTDYKRYVHLLISKKFPGLSAGYSKKGRGKNKTELDNLLLNQECQHTQSWGFSSRILLGDGHRQAK